MRHPDLRAFVEGYFGMLGAGRHEDVPGIVRYELPPDRRAFLDASTVRVTFDPALAEKFEGVELLTPGSLLLDRIIEDASSRGHHCVAKIETKESPPEKDILAANLVLRNAVAEITSSRRGPVTHLLFTFRVTLVTDEKTELLENILVNSESLREHHAGDLFFEEALALPEEPPAGGKKLKSVYDAACEALETRIQSAVAESRDGAAKRLEGEEQRIRDYFTGLMREAKESRYLDHAEAAIAAYSAEEKKRLEEAALKYRLEADVKLVGVRTILVPNVRMAVSFKGGRKSRETELEYDEVSLEIPPMRCEGCDVELKDAGVCDEGHIICARCEQKCALCDRLSCSACAENLQISQKCAQCGRLLCGAHAIRDDYGLGIYCSDHVVDCPSCGKKASGSFVARCGKCSQKYCFLCVGAKEKSCSTCRSLTAVSADDAEVARVKSQSAFSAKFGKWRKAGNRRYTIVEGRSMLAKRTFVLDQDGRLVWEG